MSAKASSWAVATALALAACQIPTGDQAAKEAAISEALREAARAAEYRFDYGGAATHYETLYETDPKDYGALVAQARNMRYVGAVREAIKLVREGIERHGEKYEFVFELGKLQLAGSMLNDARASLLRARELRPRDWQVHSALGILHDRFEEHDAAMAAFHKALELSPNNPIVLNNQALSLAQAGKIDEAVALLEALARGENAIPQGRQNLAVLYALKGDFANAERVARQDLPRERVAGFLAGFRRFHE